MLLVSSLTAYKLYLFKEACFDEVTDREGQIEDMARRFDWEVTITFTLLAFTLFITGLILLLQLKRNFPGLHRDYRCYLWAAVIVLSLPLFLRSVTNLCWRFWWEWPQDSDF